MNIFTEISILLGFSAGVALLMRRMGQPLIIGYILTGILVGPAGFGLVHSTETIEVLGSFGITLLLFIVGLNLNPKEIKEVGRISLMTGIGQIAFTSMIGFGLARMLGFAPVAAFYIAVALTFSSTIIILKLLTDKKEQNKLYGKIAIGFLLVQDIVAAFALLAVSAVGAGGLSYGALLLLGLKGVALFAGVALVSLFVIRRLTVFLSRSQELLFLFAIAWGFGVATLSYEMGFSLEVGALFAGVALASMPYAQEVGARLRPLRDFFIVVFFIALGAGLNITGISSLAWQAAVLSLLLLIGNPIIVMTIMGAMGYTKRTGFKAGLTVAQIGEFSIIFMLLGQRHGQVGESAVALVTIVGIITIAISSYMITYSDRLYTLLERYLGLFERNNLKKEQDSHRRHEAILLGYRRGGSKFIKLFKNLGKEYVVIDYDPDAISRMHNQSVPYVYGDATDVELLEEIGLEKVQLIISNITHFGTNAGLLKLLERSNHRAVSICHADTVEEANRLYGLGATYVMLPHYIGSDQISMFIKKNGLNKTAFKKFRDKQLEYLQSHYDEFAEAEAGAT